jgi:hypothetical protein
VQVAVPLDAPAGAYNVLVYNQQGAEALGGQMLTVAQRVREPRITGSEPQTVEAELTAVKLTLHCDLADRAAMDHLRVEWTHAGQAVEGVTGQFACDGLRAISLTLDGTLPLGESLGKVYFDSTPVYLIRLTRVDKDWGLIGHRPARVAADGPGVDVTLIGHDLTKQELAGCSASLLFGGLAVATAPVLWSDNATAKASFAPLPPAGEYSLAVSQGGTVFYQGPLTIGQPHAADQGAAAPAATASESIPQAAPGRDSTAQPDAPGASPSAKPGLPQWEDATAVKSDDDAAADAAQVANAVAEPGAAAPAAAPEQGTEPAAAAPDAAAITLKPDKIAVKQTVFRVELHGLQLAQADPGAYDASLEADQAPATLMFMGLGADSLVLLFKAPAGGWQAGARYTLTVTDKASGAPLLAREVPAE